jgi:carboxypeptidase Q
VRRPLVVVAAALLLSPAALAQRPVVPPVRGQAFPTTDPAIRRIYALGMDSSQTYRLAQVLTDSIGPRLVGSPAHRSAADWLIATYRTWGIPTREERYGTWLGWRRGRSHIDLVAPRVRSLEGTQLAFSPGTGGRVVRGELVLLPDLADSAAFRAWLPQVRGKYVAVSFPEPTCRPDSAWQAFALPRTWEQLRDGREAARRAWVQRVTRTGTNARTLPGVVEAAGAAGIVTSQWAGGYGVTRIFNAYTQRAPTVELSCEDYGLVARLAQNDQHPQIEVSAEAEFLGQQPAFNVLAEVRGTELPDEYVMLSSHLDSWDGGSGAGDDATGTVIMMEAMRILRQVYPNPRRTILAAHWDSEEQGLNGSSAFVADHPEVDAGLQALFHQDNGTGRIVSITAQGLVDASGNLARWLARVPADLTQGLVLGLPGVGMDGYGDNSAFTCAGLPGFGLTSTPWDYWTYTWHTARDTFDKIVMDDIQIDATLTAMLVYLASEDRERVSRERRTAFPPGRDGGPGSWPACRQPQRTGPPVPQ